MICPYCNKEMKKGYIQCRDGLHWTPKKQTVAALAGLGIGAVLICPNQRRIFELVCASYFRICSLYYGTSSKCLEVLGFSTVKKLKKQ